MSLVSRRFEFRPAGGSYTQMVALDEALRLARAAGELGLPFEVKHSSYVRERRGTELQETGKIRCEAYELIVCEQPIHTDEPSK